MKFAAACNCNTASSFIYYVYSEENRSEVTNLEMRLCLIRKSTDSTDEFCALVKCLRALTKLKIVFALPKDVHEARHQQLQAAIDAIMNIYYRTKNDYRGRHKL